jgi:hypothetical protein
MDEARLRRIDVSLWRERPRKTDVPCDCARCQNKYKKVTWRGINHAIWGDNKVCMYSAMFTIIRINLLMRVRTPIQVLTELKELAT